MAAIQPPPTWALPVIVEENTGKSIFSPVWLNWFLELVRVLDASGGTALQHNSLNGIQGGAASEYFHESSGTTSQMRVGGGTGVAPVWTTATGTSSPVRKTQPTLDNPVLSGVAFASLPTPAVGMLAYVTDSNTVVWGATVAGGGANKVLAWYNNANWKVVGI